MSATTLSAPPPSRPLWKAFAAILVPMMLTNILQSMAGTLDSIYLGQMIGVEAIAAVSAFFPVMFALLAVVLGLSTGAIVLIGQAWGAGDAAKARAVAGSALALLLCLGGAISVAGGLWASELMRALGTPANILSDASLCARIMLLGMPLLFTLWMATSLSRGVGDAITPLWTLLLATAIAMACTPAFIRGWFGLPQLGVASAAVSTMLASALALGWMLWHWRRIGHPFAPTAGMLRQIRFNGGLLRKVVWLGAPTGLQMLTMAMAEIVLLGLVNRHGSNATAAYGAVTQVMSWLQFPALSMGITATLVASHAIGAGRAVALPAITRTGLQLNLGLTGGLVLVVCVFAPALLRLFLTDAAVIALALQLLRLVAWTMVLRGVSMVLGGVMRASGTVWEPTAIGVLAIAGIELPAAFALDAHLGLSGIWWAYVITFVSMLVLQSGFYRLVWRHRKVERLV